VATYNIAQAKARFSELVDRALAGEEVVVARDHKPLLKLIPLRDHSQPLKPGSARGRIWMAEDFDAPLDDFKEHQ
jgi:prevent-host-death family protein